MHTNLGSCWASEASKKFGNKTFIFFGEKEISYELFFEKILSYAKLCVENIKQNEKIAFISNNNFDYLVFANAINYFGGIFVPLHPSSNKEEINKKLSKISCTKIFCGSDIDITKLEENKNIKYIKIYSSQEKHPSKKLTKNYCLILFTSGSSGMPKAVCISKENIFHSCAISQQNLQIKPKDVWLLCMPLNHIGGLSILYRSLIYGSKILLENDFSSTYITKHILESKISIASFVPTMLIKILEEMGNKKINTPITILCGGSTIDENLIKKAEKLGLKILPTYGMSEASSQVATTNPNDNFRKKNSTGKLLKGIKIKFGENKEILLKGENIATYYNEKSDEWFHTGDFGYMDEDGYIFIQGRLDRVIISGGENINPLEVEIEIAKFDFIKEHMILGKKNKKWGEMVVLVVALLDLEMAKINKNMLLKKINQNIRLDKFKLPKELYVLDTLPKLSNGKIDVEKLKDLINKPNGNK